MIMPSGETRIMRLSSVLAALLVTSVLSGCGGTVSTSATPKNPPTTTQKKQLTAFDLSDDFESGTLRGWSSTARATVSAEAAATGKFGAQITAKQEPGYLSWSAEVVKHGLTYASLRARVQVVSHGPGESLDLITIKNSRLLNNFDFFVTPDTQRFKWDLFRVNTGQSAFKVELGRWYLIQVQCTFAGTSYSARVRIDGVDQGMIMSSGQLPTTVRSVWLGSSTSKTHVQRYDDVALKLGDSWPGYLGP